MKTGCHLVFISRDIKQSEINYKDRTIQVMTDTSNINKAEPKSRLSNKVGNRITIALWIIALSSHAILLPKFLRDFSDKKHQGLM